jgi:uncharacterized protein (TIGR00730 family)
MLKTIALTFISLSNICFANPTSLKAAVFCGGNDNIPTNIKEAVYCLGQNLAKLHIGLLTGGGNSGLMKEIAEGYMSHPPALQLQAVLLESYKSKDHHPSFCKENIIWVKTLHQRLEYFYESADFFIVLPGGFGTLHEFLDCLAHHLQKPIILFNIDGHWDKIIQQFQVIIDNHPTALKNLKEIRIVNTLPECLFLLKELNYSIRRSAITGR